MRGGNRRAAVTNGGSVADGGSVIQRSSVSTSMSRTGSSAKELGQTIEFLIGRIVRYRATGRQDEVLSGVALGRLPLIAKAVFGQVAEILLIEPTHQHAAIALAHPGDGDPRAVGRVVNRSSRPALGEALEIHMVAMKMQDVQWRAAHGLQHH